MAEGDEHDVGLRIRFEGMRVSGEARVDEEAQPRRFGSWLGLLSLLEEIEPHGGARSPD
jgi:hypothetical protein